jgi:hypothetical protein
VTDVSRFKKYAIDLGGPITAKIVADYRRELREAEAQIREKWDKGGPDCQVLIDEMTLLLKEEKRLRKQKWELEQEEKRKAKAIPPTKRIAIPAPESHVQSKLKE